ncbi:hypothetical protein N4R57_00115 [Rhodobacteraceae bacterium D3-12]|nr:hypothetical protein N4R57_00115 [Rhodobacteraceae bacterium D3-12]
MANIVTPTASAASAAAAQSAAAANATTSGQKVISSDFQTFLQMMTAQMTNQDPLNPIDSSDYAVQLATFSSVEQQVLTNDLLTSMISQMSSTSISQLAGWVGMDARTTAPINFDGSPVTLSPRSAVLADEAWLVVRDATGTEVSREAINLSGDDIVWAGVGANGSPLANGVYGFEVENFAKGEAIGTTPVEHYANVTEAQNVDGVMVLMLDGGVPVYASDVTALRNPI